MNHADVRVLFDHLYWVRDRILEADLEGPCGVESRGTHPFWFHPQPLYAHGIQQLSDAAVILSRAGRSPGELDFLDFLRQRDAGE